MLHALIMAGGGGTRFWPRSRAQRPKQFLALAGDRTLLQQAFDRIEAAIAPGQTWVITSAAYRDETARQLPDVPPQQIIGEPCGRDTAACIGLGAALIVRADPAAVMLVMPADHVIEPAQEFRRAAHVAAQLAEENPDSLITFGIPPNFPSVHYGYIHRGAEFTRRQGIGVFHVRGFREKPPHDLAERFFSSGEYFWNSGIFVWKASTILKELHRHRPALAAAVERIADAWATPHRLAVFQREYQDLERLSIDYAVMEHAREVLAVQAPYRWDDVGSWLALERMHPQDAAGNTLLATHCGLKTSGCVIVADPGHLIATVGVRDLLIIQDGNVTLVADRRDEAAIKQLVAALKDQNLERYL
ncbi:MAG: mannose-1-phosphate guanylyltransferase [Gemmataceae bacterium]|nr:mannose-1-phosphate guanylyltransferase [Gemmataceae bacterium]MDW8265797.1 mannose-1-phosphate guanylyltransferase [Gemmataceae bacterium]